MQLINRSSLPIAAVLAVLIMTGCATGPNRSMGAGSGNAGHHMAMKDGQEHGMCPMHGGKMGDGQMQGSCPMHGKMHGGMQGDMHGKMMGRRTPEERKAMMAEHIRNMPPEMLQKRAQMLQRQSEMIDAEMQMIKERLAAQPAAK